ncbi:MAG TPA: 30S ribosomal protein S16 [Bacteroidales bacterium]|nr:30S ribosomal protein S16 [Bacteroidales bacterium]HNS45932.1 30S ribosomal protein S16 [Bacteroidales bacterium]
MRLQRFGKKGRAFFHIVIADGRAPRDGRYVEKIGTYNPLTQPAEINLDVDKALEWLKNGAQPSETVRAILSYKGVLYKKHLLKGVEKGALTLAQAEAKYNEWIVEKEAKISAVVKTKELQGRELLKKRTEEELKVMEAISAKITQKRAKELKAEAEEVEARAEEAVEQVTEPEQPDSRMPDEPHAPLV